jgi:hypothetical protein
MRSARRIRQLSRAHGTNTRAAVCFLLLLDVSATAWGASPGTSSAGVSKEASATPSEPTPVEADEVSFTRALIPDPVPLGKPFRYEIRFKGPVGARVFFPPEPAMGKLHLDETSCAPAAPEAPGLDLACVIELRAFRLGRHSLPDVEVAVSLPAGGDRTLVIPGRRLEVVGHLVDQASPSMRDAYPPVAIEERNWPLLITAALLATVVATAALTLLVLLVLRRFVFPRRFERPRPPAHVVAFGRLEDLSRRLAGLEDDEADRDVFFELSEVLREYMGNRYAFDALEMTTSELMARLESEDLQGVGPTEIEGFLAFHDLVKYARQAATREEADRLVAEARDIVDRTLYVAPEKPIEEEQIPEFVYAPRLERAAAFALDASLPLVLPAALILSGAVDGPLLPALAWLGVLVPWLVLRDLAGQVSPGHRLFAHRLLDERLDLLAAPAARLRRNLTLALPLIGWTVEALVVTSLTGDQRVGDQMARTSVAVPTRHRPRALLALGVLSLCAAAWVAVGLLMT